MNGGWLMLCRSRQIVFVSCLSVVLSGAAAAQAQTVQFPDVSGDCVIGAADLAVVLTNFGAAGGPVDLNNDGVVNGAEIASILNAWALKCEDVANLRLSLGVHDTEVPTAKETSLGSFTVANLNDTNGDGTIDRDDMDTSATAGGRDDVDLMRLVIDKPTPSFGGGVKVTLVSGDVKFWEKKTKQTEVVFTAGSKTFPVATLPKTIWVEARSASAALRDIVIKSDYFGASDTVKATAVWATIAAVEHNRMTPAQLFAMGTPWAKITEPPEALVRSVGGTGLLPEFLATFPSGQKLGLFNAILIKFQIAPKAVVGVIDGGIRVVRFDGTRQIAVNDWAVAGATVQLLAGSKTFPATDELPNDDTGISDKSKPEGNADGEYFDFDTPGFGSEILLDFLVSKFSAREFLRVRFDGTRPGSNMPGVNVLDGSRCSPKQAWHVSHLLKKNAATGRLIRSDGGGANETASNDVATGTININPVCAAEVGDAAGMPGQTKAVSCTIMNLTNASKTYTWALAVAGGPSLTPMPAGGSITIAAHKAVTVPLNVKVNAGSAAGTATLTLTVSQGGDSCSETGVFTVTLP